MASVDVHDFRRSLGGTSGMWWKAAVCFLGKSGNGNVVEAVNIILLGNVVPFDVSKLAVVAHVSVSEAAVQKEACNIGVLWLVGSIELVGAVVQPNLELFLRRLVSEVRWSFPRIERATNTGKVWIGVVWSRGPGRDGCVGGALAEIRIGDKSDGGVMWRGSTA